jgi:hypothetical protein
MTSEETMVAVCPVSILLAVCEQEVALAKGCAGHTASLSNNQSSDFVSSNARLSTTNPFTVTGT